jgi:serine/threonine protein kinase
MTSEPSHWVGRDIAGGRYRVTAKLGEGGMGFVFRAHDRHLDCEVVLKAPRPELLGSPTATTRFAREVHSLVALAHPHVVRILDVGDHEGVPFFVLPYLPGGNLRDRQAVGADGRPLPLPLQHLGGWLQDVATALDFIHRQRFVHRDVKPENILFDAHGNAYVADFGLAKALHPQHPQLRLGASTGTDTVVGTARYMAPERVRAEPYDGRVDQYALAVTVYELLAGRAPFEGAFPAAIMMAHTVFEPPPLPDVVPSVPRPIADAVRRGLAKDPSQRFPDCGSFARAVLEGAVESGTRSVYVTVPGEWYRRSKGGPPEGRIRSARTPGAVPLGPGESHALHVDISVTDSQLAGIEDLRSVPGLHEISLRWCDQVSDLGLARLRGLPHLTALDLSGCQRVTEVGLEHVAVLVHLERLHLASCTQITDVGLTRLRNLAELETVGLSGCRNVTDAGMADVGAFTQLRRLSLGRCEQVTHKGLAHLRGLHRFRALHLSSCPQVSVAMLAEVQGLTRLVTLLLDSCPEVDDVGLAQLRSLERLEVLDLGWCERITDAGLEHLRPLTCLESLHLSGCRQVTDTGLAAVSDFRFLRQLNLERCAQVTDKGLESVARLAHLQSLDLRGCHRLTDAGLASVAQLRHLKHLNLEECHGLSDRGLEHLAALTRLESLVLYDCPRVTDSGLTTLRNLLPHCAVRR